MTIDQIHRIWVPFAGTDWIIHAYFDDEKRIHNIILTSRETGIIRSISLEDMRPGSLELAVYAAAQRNIHEYFFKRGYLPV